MMLKVSFKNDFKKVETFNDKATLVKLTGRVRLPKWWYRIPEAITIWAWQHPSVKIVIGYPTNEAIIMTQGISKCSDEDTFDAGIGERIAECKAKIKIYKFMQTLTKMLCEYYHGLSLGKDAIVDIITYPKDSLHHTFIKYTELLLHERHHLSMLLQKTV